MSGQLVLDVPFIPGEEAYPLLTQDWPAGLYAIEIFIDANQPLIRKLVVAH